MQHLKKYLTLGTALLFGCTNQDYTTRLIILPKKDAGFESMEDIPLNEDIETEFVPPEITKEFQNRNIVDIVSENELVPPEDISANDISCPSVYLSKAQTATIDQLFTFDIADNTSKTVSSKYTALDLPSGATLDTLTQIVSWKPQCGQEGEYLFSFFKKEGSCPAEKHIPLTVITPPVTCFATEFTTQSVIGYIRQMYRTADNGLIILGYATKKKILFLTMQCT